MSEHVRPDILEAYRFELLMITHKLVVISLIPSLVSDRHPNACTHRGAGVPGHATHARAHTRSASARASLQHSGIPAAVIFHRVSHRPADKPLATLHRAELGPSQHWDPCHHMPRALLWVDARTNTHTHACTHTHEHTNACTHTVSC